MTVMPDATAKRQTTLVPWVSTCTPLCTAPLTAPPTIRAAGVSPPTEA